MRINAKVQKTIEEERERERRCDVCKSGTWANPEALEGWKVVEVIVRWAVSDGGTVYVRILPSDHEPGSARPPTYANDSLKYLDFCPVCVATLKHSLQLPE